MFNRAPYNRTAFNRASFLVFEWTATVHASTEATAKLVLAMQLDSQVEAAATGSGMFVRIILPESMVETEAVTTAWFVRRMFMKALAEAISSAKGTKVSIYELVTMVIENINMSAGDLLFIDTEHMNVMLNGESVVDKIVRGSGFFYLQPGENSITVSETGTADIKILWKDRWL